MKYIASLSYKVGNYSIKWQEWFDFREDAVDALRGLREGIKRHHGEENVKEFKESIRRVKD